MFKVTWIRYIFLMIIILAFGREMVDVKTLAKLILFLFVLWRPFLRLHNNNTFALVIFEFLYSRRLFFPAIKFFYVLLHKIACLVHQTTLLASCFSLLCFFRFFLSNCEYACVQNGLPEVKKKWKWEERKEIVFKRFPFELFSTADFIYGVSVWLWCDVHSVVNRMTLERGKKTHWIVYCSGEWYHHSLSFCRFVHFTFIWSKNQIENWFLTSNDNQFELRIPVNKSISFAITMSIMILCLVFVFIFFYFFSTERTQFFRVFS